MKPAKAFENDLDECPNCHVSLDGAPEGLAKREWSFFKESRLFCKCPDCGYEWDSGMSDDEVKEMARSYWDAVAEASEPSFRLVCVNGEVVRDAVVIVSKSDPNWSGDPYSVWSKIMEIRK